MRLIGGFLVGLWLARYLGPSDFGLLSMATAATYFGVVATQLGVDGLVQRELVLRPREAGVIMGTVTVMSAFVAMCSWGIIAAVALVSVADPALRTVLLWLGLLVVPQAAVAWEYLLQARSDLRPVVLGQNLCFAGCLALRAILIGRHAPVVAFAIVAVVERAGGAAAVILWASRRQQIGRLGFDRGLAQRIVGEAWPVWLSALLTTGYLKIDQILLVRWSGDAAAGIYAAATRLSELWWSISTIVATAVLPDLVRTKEVGNRRYWLALQRYFDASAAVTVAAAAAMTALAPTLVRFFYGARYAEASAVLVIQFWAGIFIFLSVARGRHLVTVGKRQVELWFSVAGVTLNLAANAFLIPRLGGVGAAWSGLFTQAVVCTGLPWCFPETRAIVRMQIVSLCMPWRMLEKSREGWRRLKQAVA